MSNLDKIYENQTVRAQFSAYLAAVKEGQMRHKPTACPRCGEDPKGTWIPSVTGLCYVCETCASSELAHLAAMTPDKPITEWAVWKKFTDSQSNDVRCPECGKKVARKTVTGAVEIKCHGCKELVYTLPGTMHPKFFEVRDRGTKILVMAIKMISTNDIERYFLKQAGFGQDYPSVMVTRLFDSESQIDPYKWTSGGRTMREAHIFIEEHFDELETGAVVDVEYILGETDTPKKSDMVR